jgi:hypothetical protein
MLDVLAGLARKARDHARRPMQVCTSDTVFTIRG